MRRLGQYSICLLLVLPYLAIVPLSVQAEISETMGDGGQALTVFVEGKASVKRKGWTGYAPVVFGTRIGQGDLLRIEESSHAKVVCSDLTMHEIASGASGLPCPTTTPVLHWIEGSSINATRSWPSDGSFPIVIFPRKTKLLFPQPLLRWTHVSGASEYTVAIRGDNFYWWSVVNRSGTSHEVATEMVYPEKAPKLAAGTDYKLIVQTQGGSSSDEPGPGLGFSIMDSKERRVVEKEQRRVEQLALPKGPTEFLIAYLYAGHGLNAEAILRLESIPPTFKAAAVARLLGDLYLNVGLARQAEASYLNALSLSKAEKDEEGEMLAHFNLARIYAQALGNKHSASDHLDAVLALAEKIGDHFTASQAEKQLAELKRAMVP